MQNRYAGDCGDLMKLALLRALDGELRLGVNWYRVPDESHNGDGKHRGYLSDARYLQADAELARCLAAAVATERSVAALERSRLFADGTLFYEPALDYSGLARATEEDRRARLAHREAWFARAVDRLAGADIVFLDPDNGIETASVPLHRNRGPKYAALAEIAAHIESGQSVILYQHMTRAGSKRDQARARLGFLARHFSVADAPFAAITSPGSVRYFLVLPTDRRAAALRDRWEALAAGPWAWAMQIVA